MSQRFNPVPPHERASFLDREQRSRANTLPPEHELMRGPVTWIYGAGAQGRDIDCDMRPMNAKWVTDETLGDASSGDLFVPATGDPVLRRLMVQKAEARGLVLTSYISPRAFVPETTKLEPGCIVMPGAVLMADVTLKRGALVNIGALVGHDCVIGEFASIQPGANLTGRVQVGDGAYIGIGAVLITKDAEHPLTIGSRAIVGGGTVLFHNIAPDTTWVGNPARRVK